VVWPRAGIVAYAEPWYAAYVMLAVVQGGMLPVLLPLSARDAAQAGLIIGVMNLAGLSAPFLGHLADRRGWHRRILLAGLIIVAAGLIVMPLGASIGVQMAAALALGIGFAGANTVATMFIVEVHPPTEWDGRIGALQASAAAGQVGGLLLAGLFGQPYLLAFIVAGGLVVVALPIAWRTLRHVGVNVPAATPRGHVAAPAPVGAEGCSGGVSRHVHHLSAHGLRDLLVGMETPFARLLLAWFLAFTGIGAVLTMFPLAMLRVFGAPSHVASSTYAFAAAVSLPVYFAAARLSRRFGPGAMLRVGFLVRLLALACMALACSSAPDMRWLALAAFVILVLAWPALAVSGTALAALLAPVEKGEALGLFNAVSSLAGASGALLGGWAFQAFGYGRVCEAAVLAVTAALVVAGAGVRPRAGAQAGATS
jgi:MFS family permease